MKIKNTEEFKLKMKNYLIHNLCSLEKEDGLFKMRIIERILLSYEGIEEKDAGVNFINTKVIATDPQVKDIQPSDSSLGRYRVYDNILYVNNDIDLFYLKRKADSSIFQAEDDEQAKLYFEINDDE